MQHLRLETMPAAPPSENAAALDPCFLRHLLPQDLGEGVCVQERKGPVFGLFAARYGCSSVRAWGVLPNQLVTLALVVQADGSVRANGMECGRHALLIFGEASPVFLYAEGPLTLAAIQMHRSQLPSAWLGALSDSPTSPANLLLASLPAAPALQWAEALGRLAGLYDPGESARAPAPEVECEITQLLAVLPAPSSLAVRMRRPPQARRQALLAAVLGEGSNADTKLRVPALMQLLGVSRRTLEYEIEELAGLSPHAWLTALRLDRVRSDLMQGCAGAVVASAGARWGFSHQGRLARAYRARFGELPRVTAARAAMRFAV